MSRTEIRLRVATRGSALALRQTELAIDSLRRAASSCGFDLTPEVVRIRTEGDRVTDVPFEAIGPKGVFAHEIQRALATGEVDIAVHSLKDLPASEPPGLVIAAVLPRADPRDVVVSTTGRPLAELAFGATVGTSSARRRSLLANLHPHLRSVALRGNVDTRVRRVVSGEIDAAILAAAGLIRLERTDAVAEWLAPEVFVPPPGQGVVAIEAREGALDADLSWLRSVDHDPTRRAVEAERTCMDALEGGCEVPLGVWARVVDDEIHCDGFVSTADGLMHARASVRGSDPNEVGLALVERLNDRGAAAIVQAARSPGGDR